jgi:glycosyltransferase involved in cell wall biosynthesis
MPTPLFSIVINNYNYARFLPQAVDSALAQTGDREVVIVDDGSTDESAAVLDHYEALGCVVVRKPNGGQASAFNAGFAKARGEWIWFLDADDVLTPGALEKVRAVLRPGLAKVHFPLAVFREGVGPTGGLIEGGGLSAGDVTREIAATGHHSWPPTSGNVFSRDCLAAILPMDAEKYRISADLYLNSHAPFLGEIAAIDEPLARYRLHGANLYAGDKSSPKARVAQSVLAVRAAEILERRLAERRVPAEPGVFYRRPLAMARLLATRFAPAGAGKANRLAILRCFTTSPEYRAASFPRRLLWLLLLAIYAFAPASVVWKAAAAREALAGSRKASA